MSSRMIPATSPIATVHLQNIADNWRMLDKLGGSCETGAVVKANAYGLGAREVSKTLFDAGCRTFFTAYVNEADIVRETLGPDVQVLVFHGPQKEDVAQFIANRLIPVINSPDQAQLWVEAGAPYPAAIHIDTGINRLGVRPSQIETVRKILPETTVGWVMSHLACADEPDHPLNALQKQRFEEAAASWPRARKSLCNSAGICLGKDYAYDLTRPGLGLYGGYSRSGVFSPRHAVSVSAPLLSVFYPDEETDRTPTVGYGATKNVSRQMRLGTVSLGYADGLPRALTNKGFGYIGGALCPIVGRVSMDLVTLDITNASDDIQPMDRVEFLGLNAHIEHQAAAAGMVSYEFLTSIGVRVRRLYEGAVVRDEGLNSK